MTSAVRALCEEEILEASATLAVSFDEDTVFRFLLPDAKKRRRWLEVIMAAALHDTFPDGLVFTPTAGAGAGAMGLLPPGGYPTPFRRTYGFLTRRLPRPGIPFPSWRLLRSGIAALRAVGRVHIQEPHYYVYVIGVDPERKGQGLGGALIGHAASLADRDGVALYLETGNEANLGFYRRYGFDVAVELVTPGGGPPIWTMFRPSRTGSRE